MEVDNEVSGNGNSYTTQFRQYDPRLGRWKSLDPLMAKFPWMSPYVSFNNNPVYFIDPYGLEGVNPDEGEPVLDLENVDVVAPKNDDLPENGMKGIGIKGNTTTGQWNDYTKKNFLTDDKTIKRMETVMSWIQKQEKNFDKLSPRIEPKTDGDNIEFETLSDAPDDYGLRLTMNYVTSKGNKVPIYITVYGYSDADQDTDVQLGATNWSDIMNEQTDCYMTALGLVGYLGVIPNLFTILNDDYTPTSTLQVGAVGITKDGGYHAISIIGQENGEFIYSSGWTGQYKVTGNWETILEEGLSPKGMDMTGDRDTKPTDYIWYKRK